MQYMELVIEKLGLSTYNENKYIKKLSEKTKLRPEYISMILFVLVLILLLFTPFGHTILKSFFTYLYPAYRSFRAKISESKADDRKWLIYWIVYGLVFSLEVVFGYFIGVSRLSIESLTLIILFFH